MSQNRIRGPLLLTLVAAASLGAGIWLVNDEQRAAPQPTVAQKPASPARPQASPVPPPPAFPERADYRGEIPAKAGAVAVDI